MQIQWGELQTLNFSTISLIRDAARKDLATASCKFGLQKAVLERISELSHSQVLSLVANVGEEPLFLPRADLTELLAAPQAVLPILASGPYRNDRPTSA